MHPTNRNLTLQFQPSLPQSQFGTKDLRGVLIEVSRRGIALSLICECGWLKLQPSPRVGLVGVSPQVENTAINTTQVSLLLRLETCMPMLVLVIICVHQHA